MRQNLKDFATLVSQTLPTIEPIYEFGSFQVSEQMEFADLRPLFPHKQYIGCDLQEGPGVDRILDLHNIDLPSESVGTVLCFDTLEHVEDPRQALKEIHRILQPNGIVIISSLMCFPIHDCPHDYWRFTPEAFKSILKPFSHSFAGFQGVKTFPHTIVGIGFKGDIPSLVEFQKGYDRWQKMGSRSIMNLGINLLPPVLIPIASDLLSLVTRLKRR